MRPLLLMLLLASSLAGCLGDSQVPDALDGGNAATAPEPMVREVRGEVTVVGAPDPVFGSAGFGFGLNDVKAEVRVPEGTSRIIVEVEWASTTPFRIAAEPIVEREEPVYIDEEPAHVTAGEGGDPGRARLVVDDPQPGVWDLTVWPDGVAHEVQATMRYVVLQDARDMALF